jgi:hypothetical protein
VHADLKTDGIHGEQMEIAGVAAEVHKAFAARVRLSKYDRMWADLCKLGWSVSMECGSNVILGEWKGVLGVRSDNMPGDTRPKLLLEGIPLGGPSRIGQRYVPETYYSAETEEEWMEEEEKERRKRRRREAATAQAKTEARRRQAGGVCLEGGVKRKAMICLEGDVKKKARMRERKCKFSGHYEE